MAHDYFTVLGLSPGTYDPGEITRRFVVRRQRLLSELHNPARHIAARRELEELHVAHTVLRDPAKQAEYLRERTTAPDRVTELRRLIAATLEDGLLRYSRRQMILERASELGLSEFQAQLLIAQTQFGGDEAPVVEASPAARQAETRSAKWMRFAAAGVVGVAMFLYMVYRVVP
jgi:hypothetical protein